MFRPLMICQSIYQATRLIKKIKQNSIAPDVIFLSKVKNDFEVSDDVTCRPRVDMFDFFELDDINKL